MNGTQHRTLLCKTISLSDTDPGYKSLTNVTAPFGDTPTRPLNVLKVCFGYAFLFDYMIYVNLMKVYAFFDSNRIPRSKLV